MVLLKIMVTTITIGASLQIGTEIVTTIITTKVVSHLPTILGISLLLTSTELQKILMLGCTTKSLIG